MSEDRKHMIGLRLSSEELERLDALSARNGLSRVNMLRMLVKHAHDGAKRKMSPHADVGAKRKARNRPSAKSRKSTKS